MKALVTGGMTILLGVALCAQSSDMKAKAQQFSQSAKANVTALRMYSWTMRVTVTLKGDPKPAKLYAMHFDSSGAIQKTLLNPDSTCGADPRAEGEDQDRRRSRNSRNGPAISLTSARDTSSRRPRCSRRSSRRC